MKHWLIALGITAVCTGCAPKALPLPDAQPVPPSSAEEMAAFQAPSLYVPPVEQQPLASLPVQKPPGANEVRYKWEDGKANLVQVQVGYPTVIRLQPTEKITSIVDGDRSELDVLQKPGGGFHRRPLAQTAPTRQTTQLLLWSTMAILQGHK